VAQLANFFLQESCQAFDKKLSLFNDDVLQVFKNYAWPGNVRELKHVIERLVVTAKGKSLTVKDLPKEIREAKTPSAATRGSLPKAEAEKQNIQKALLETNGNKSKAADRLGITRKTLFNKMKLYDLK
jgi:two-component system response regulator HydG